jgi:hypothetical protein
MRPETAQEQQDELLSKCIGNLKSRRSFEAVLAEVDVLVGAPSTAYDPLEQVLIDNPSLTRKKAEEMAQAFGF